MNPVIHIEGLAAPLLRDNIDTDVIIPSREITSPSREGFGAKLFAPWRYLQPGGAEDPAFILNREPWRHAVFLVAGRNFGCGSSREMAVWALVQFGIRCVVAPSFGAIFRNNCIRNGLLPLELPDEVVRAIAGQAEQGACALHADVPRQRLRTPDGQEHAFALDAEDREMLITGMDAIDRTWQQRDAIEAFEAQDRLRRPWMW
ncbi:MAG: 3-isopropylmalate dehydratase small subunit [Rubrivivax sp.]|nr:3-isopropylmalate dehydratase small subunit [Rubrivivax sp.]